MISTLDQALDYLYSFINYETDASWAYSPLYYNLERTARLLDLMGNPGRDLEVIHVAGTKGKGSVCAVLERVLTSAGYVTGRFLSPHIERVNERITIGAGLIPDSDLIDLIAALPPLVDTFPGDNRPTTFELLTASALSYFQRKCVRYAVMETGMGGRFDATNVVRPLVSVITSVSYDHMDKLGDTIEQIAAEKAGIIKPSRPVVVGFQPFEVMDIFQNRARETGSALYRVDELCRYTVDEMGESGTSFSAEIDGTELPGLFVSLPGAHQVQNTVAALLSLKVAGLLPDAEVLRGALASIRIPARLESIEAFGRKFLLDAAHNRDSARVLARALKELFPGRRVVAVVGIVKGKDYRGILEQLSEVADELIVTEPVTHKELETGQVYRAAHSMKQNTVLERDINRALRCAVGASRENDVILVTGSFYTIAPARELLLKAPGG
jgi:dihydrofolate synthase/folylpolyglutamate synthase